MKKLIIIVVIGFTLFGLYEKYPVIFLQVFESKTSGDQVLKNAYANKESDIQVKGSGLVTRILPDDIKGSRHQRFIIKLSSGQSLLISHNIDIAPKIVAIKEGDRIDFIGEYEWNSKGGVIHWTHHDPNGNHVNGWLKHNGMTYQ
jgi:hypothetical protein